MDYPHEIIERDSEGHVIRCHDVNDISEAMYLLQEVMGIEVKDDDVSYRKQNEDRIYM